jgi:nucleoside-diphosphate-sugar epimerase
MADRLQPADLDLPIVQAPLAGGGLAPDVRGAGIPPGEIDRQYVDSTRLRERTGWRPRVGLEEGLRRTIGWYRRYG